jgi:membrane protein DedA with SNARE-associated domain
MAERLLMEYGYVLVFLGTVLEGDATLLTASFLAQRGYFGIVEVMLTAAFATSLWNEIVYHGARRAGKTYLEQRVDRHPRYRRVLAWVRRRSVLLLLFSRYIFGFRLAIPAACGAAGMRPLLFTAVNLAGAVVWVVPVAIAGYAFAGVLEAFWHEVKQYEWHIATAMLVLITALLARFDPELTRTAEYLFRVRRAAVRSEARVRRLLTRLPATDESGETHLRPDCR